MLYKNMEWRQYPEINITVFKRQHFNKTTKVEKCEDAKGVHRRYQD
jgi:hypothetical protein